VDTDQFATIERLPGLVDPAPWRGHILTSMLKHVDKGIYTVVEEYARGEFRPGLRQFGLSADAVNLSYSGGFIDAIRPRIDAFKASIVAGDIDVPCVPVDKRDEALERGLVELDCLD
jgi:basic membrane protein A